MATYQGTETVNDNTGVIVKPLPPCREGWEILPGCGGGVAFIYAPGGGGGVVSLEMQHHAISRSVHIPVYDVRGYQRGYNQTMPGGGAFCGFWRPN